MNSLQVKWMRLGLVQTAEQAAWSKALNVLFSMPTQVSFFFLSFFSPACSDFVVVLLSLRFVEQPSDIKLRGSELHVYNAKLLSPVNIRID